MTATPSPDEARQALQDVEHRRGQTAAAADWPVWTWITGGILAAAWGLIADQFPQFVRTWGTPIVVLLLILALAAKTRWGGALLRRPVRTRTSFNSANTGWLVLVLILLTGAGTVAAVFDVPHTALWAGLAGGLLLAIAGPWWQRRILTREARP